METRIIFHVDFDYFFAQCEELRNPDLKTKPVCVCVFSDRGGDSGAIATANYLARGHGIKSGMPITMAKKKLRDVSNAIFLPTDFSYYSEISQKAMTVIENFADIFEYVGRDEAFLDVTNKTEGNFSKGSHLAQQLKIAIRSALKLSCSIGVSPNKLISKIASDFQKPDGLTIISPDQVKKFLDPLTIRSIPGIGKKSEELLTKMGIKSILDLKTLDIFSLNSKFGRKFASYLYNAARGIDVDPVSPKQEAIQFSRIVTLKEDSKDLQVLSKRIEKLCEEVYESIIKYNITFRLIGIQFVQEDLSNKTRSRTLKNSTSSLEELKKIAFQLLEESLKDQKLLIRRVGVKVSDLSVFGGQDNLTRYF